MNALTLEIPGVFQLKFDRDDRIAVKHGFQLRSLNQLIESNPLSAGQFSNSSRLSNRRAGRTVQDWVCLSGSQRSFEGQSRNSGFAIESSLDHFLFTLVEHPEFNGRRCEASKRVVLANGKPELG